jgi:hypothetical protein
MKKFYLLLFLAGQFVISAQAPQLINYQGIARNAAGLPVVNKPISLRFDVRAGNPTGTIVYSDEQQGVPTNSLGLFSTQIGKAAGVSTVNWEQGDYYLEVSLDIAGGTAYVSMGVQQLVSVPFALHARSVPASYNGSVLTVGTKTMAIESPTFVSSGAITVTNTGNSYTISAPAPSLTAGGSATVQGSYPSYTISTPAR